MKKLKIVLNYNYIIYFIFSISIVYLTISNIFKPNTYLKENTIKIKTTIINYDIDGNKLTMIVKNKNKYIVNYYFKTKEEKFKYNIGDKIIIIGIVNIPKNNTNKDLFNYKNYLLSKKIKYIINADEIKLQEKNKNIFFMLKNNIYKKIDKYKTKDYIKTFILADKSDMNNEIISAYQYLGVSHLFSVSGMHVSLMSLLLLKILNKLKEEYKYFIVIIFLIMYLFLTSFSISILRATLQFILFYLNEKYKLKIKNTNIILFIISLFIFYNPYVIYDVSFQFSFTISFILILYSSKLKSNNFITNLFLISLLSFVSSLPILINNFNTVNFLSILYNMVYVPLVSYIIFPLGLITLFIPQLDSIYNYIITNFEHITFILQSIKIFSFDIANIPIILIILYYFIIYSIYKNPHKYEFIIMILLLIVFINYKKIVLNPYISIIDVGQGDSTLIRIKNKNILIDTGGKIKYEIPSWKQRKKEYSVGKDTIIPYLKKQGVKKLDYMILTHGDYDHMGEARIIVNNFKIENVILNYDEINDIEKNLITILEKKNIKYYLNIEKIKVNNIIFYFLNSKIYDNENDNSNVIYFKIYNYKFLFMGDAGIKREKEIIKNYNLENIDFIKIGHHGSNTSSNKYFIDNIKPKNCLISVGKNNRYGHPKKKVLDTLNNYCDIYRTDLNGNIEIKINKNNYKIKTYSLKGEI